MTEPKWLITYSQWTGRKTMTITTVSDLHPADWLAKTIERCPGAETAILFVLELDDERYRRLKEML